VRAILYEMQGDGCVALDMLDQAQEIWRTGRQGGSANEVPALIGAMYSCTSPAALMGANYDFQLHEFNVNLYEIDWPGFELEVCERVYNASVITPFPKCAD